MITKSTLSQIEITVGRIINHKEINRTKIKVAVIIKIEIIQITIIQVIIIQTETASKAIINNLKEIIVTNNSKDIKTIIIIIKDSTHSKVKLKIQIKSPVILK